MAKIGTRALAVLCMACAFASAHAARAEGLATVNIAVDATATGSPLKKVWAYHGFDEVNYSTSPEGHDLLHTLGAIGSDAPHIRSHFLLNSGDGAAALKWGSTDVYSEDANGNPIYSWTLMDGIMDAVTSAGTLPFVEIGFMPHDLAAPPADPYRNSGTYTLDGHCFNPPKDFGKWGELIRSWAAHVRDRYPNVESSWEWELWNEPDIPYWNGTLEQYSTLYDYTEAALHSILPNAKLGGPAVVGAGSMFLRQFLQHCATGANAVTGATGTRLDTVSFHAKGGVNLVDGHVEMNLGSQLYQHRVGFESIAANPYFKQTPIVISEADPDGCAACALADHPEDAYRNSPAYAAYVVTMMKRTLELEERVGVNLRGVLTWAFLFNGTPYFAGYRVLSTNGIHLPVLNAFKLLGKLDGARVPLTSTESRTLDDILVNSVRADPDIDGIATRSGQQVTALVWNYHDDLVAADATPVHLTVALPASFGNRAAVTHLRVDDTHGDAYTVWLSQGSPAAPNSEQAAALRQAMEPSAIAPSGVVDVAGGAVNLDFALPRFAISLITLTPAPDAGTEAFDAGAPNTTPSHAPIFASGGGCSCRQPSANASAWSGACILALFAAVRGAARRRATK